MGRPGIGMPPSPGTGIWDHNEDDVNKDDNVADDNTDDVEDQPPLDEPPSDLAQPWLGSGNLLTTYYHEDDVYHDQGPTSSLF